MSLELKNQKEEAVARKERPLKILMVAYACSPLRTSEHFLGWEWARRLSESHHITVITQARRIAESDGLRPENLSMLPVEVRGFQWLRGLGPLGQAIHLQLWQRSAARLGQQVLADEKFDLVHQTTFHTYRIPGLLARKGNPPFVWGPIAGLEDIPLRMIGTLGAGAFVELLRRVANIITPHLPPIRRTLREAARVVVSNNQTLRRLQTIFPRSYELMPANAIDLTQFASYRSNAVKPPTCKDRLTLIAVGSFVRMRPFNLVVEAIAGLPEEARKRLFVEFVGDGPDLGRLLGLVESNRLLDCISFRGRMSKPELFELMSSADLLLFPSLRDSGSSVVSEALALNLPVMALDLAGPAEILARGGGVLVPASTPAQTRAAIGKALAALIADPSSLENISDEASAIAEQNSWDARIAQMNRIYREALTER